MSELDPNAETVAALIEANEQSATERMKLADGAVRATCYLERHPSGLWFFYSDELRGLLLTHHDLPTLLGAIPDAGKCLRDAMRDWHAKTPYTEEKQLTQMKAYEDFFGDLP